ncbi:MAG: kelch repeat-containing protein, partial [Rubrivivax sp.]|nr:kelch repeat-containing protein [Rubrivivax sp.]
MTDSTRRRLLLAGAGALGLPRALAQNHAGHHGAAYESLTQPGRIGLPAIAATQHVFDSPAPRAGSPGRWLTRAALPLPRSEMAWAVEYAGQMHLVGGYGEQRVDRSYHQVYDALADRWTDAAPLPRGANHVGVATLGGRLYAIGGHAEQNRKPHGESFAYDGPSNRWSPV